MSWNDSSECTCTEAYALLLDLDKHIISYGGIWKHLLNHPGLERFHQCPEWEVPSCS